MIELSSLDQGPSLYDLTGVVGAWLAPKPFSELHYELQTSLRHSSAVVVRLDLDWSLSLQLRLKLLD